MKYVNLGVCFSSHICLDINAGVNDMLHYVMGVLHQYLEKTGAFPSRLVEVRFGGVF